MKKLFYILTAIFLLPSSSLLAQSFGDGVAAYSLQDYEKAREIWLKLGNEGDTQSQYRLALLYELGLGVEQNDDEAHIWYLKSAEGGYGPSQFSLANNYAIGRGVIEDPYQAFEWYLIAAENNMPKAQLHVGTLYVIGEVVKKDLVEAYYWVSQAAFNFPDGPERTRALTLLNDIGNLMSGDDLIVAKNKVDNSNLTN